MDIYLNRASYILPDNFWRKIWNPVNLFAPKYPNKNLKQLLEEKFGANKLLSDVADQYGVSPVFLLAALDLNPELEKKIVHRIKKHIFVTAEVEIVAYGDLPRSERKSKRVFDKREV